MQILLLVDLYFSKTFLRCFNTLMLVWVHSSFSCQHTSRRALHRHSSTGTVMQWNDGSFKPWRRKERWPVHFLGPMFSLFYELPAGASAVAPSLVFGRCNCRRSIRSSNSWSMPSTGKAFGIEQSLLLLPSVPRWRIDQVSMERPRPGPNVIHHAWYKTALIAHRF